MLLFISYDVKNEAGRALGPQVLYLWERSARGYHGRSPLWGFAEAAILSITFSICVTSGKKLEK